MIFYGTWIEELVASYVLLPFHVAFYFIARAMNKHLFVPTTVNQTLGLEGIALKNTSQSNSPALFYSFPDFIRLESLTG